MVTPQPTKKPPWFNPNKHEVDQATGVIKKIGWIVLQHTPANPMAKQLQAIGFNEVAKWLASAEGITVAQAEAKLRKAEADAKVAEAQKKGV